MDARIKSGRDREKSRWLVFLRGALGLGELRLELFLEPDQVLGQRHAEGAHLVQLLADLQIELMRILRLVLHLVDEECKFRLQIVKCHCPGLPEA
jgi:hypothetical protein